MKPNMDIRIEYCVVWNYEPRALSLGDALSKQFGTKIELKPGARGSFEVFANDHLVFSKLASGDFPKDQDVISFIEGVLNVT